MRAKCQKTACSSAFTSWLTLKKHGVFFEENRDVVKYTPTFAPFLYLLLLDWMVSYMHFESCWVALLKNFVVVMFSFTLSS